MPFVFIAIAVVVVALICANIRIVPQTEVFIIERFGSFRTQWDAGLHVKTPFIDKIVSKVSLKEQVLDFPPQGVITKDNVTMQIDSVVFMKVINAKDYTYGINNPIIGVENLAATTLRNIVGSLDFDETLTSRDKINTQMEQILDSATDPWGIKVTRVEVKNINPPREIEEVMTKQMKAEREKRQAILEADAHKMSAITRAEGDKEAKVLAAQAEKETQIQLAQGRAESIRMIYEAQAEGMEKLKKAAPDAAILKLEGFKALEKIADGNATKIFMPSDITNLVSGLGVAGEALDLNKTMPVNPKIRTNKPVKPDACITPNSSYISRENASRSETVEQNLVGKIDRRSDTVRATMERKRRELSDTN